MTITEILTSLDPAATSLAHLGAAATLAARHHARLTVLCIQPVRDIPLGARLQMRTDRLGDFFIAADRRAKDHQIGVFHGLCRAVHDLAQFNLGGAMAHGFADVIAGDGSGQSFALDGMRQRRADQSQTDQGDAIEHQRPMNSVSAATTR